MAFSSASSRTAAETNADDSAIIHIDNVADFERLVLNANAPVLVDFYSNSCPPCRMLAPTVEQLAEEHEGRAVVCKVNVDMARPLARQHGIQAVPAVLFFKQGRETERLVGLKPKSAYAHVLDRLIG